MAVSLTIPFSTELPGGRAPALGAEAQAKIGVARAVGAVGGVAMEWQNRRDEEKLTQAKIDYEVGLQQSDRDYLARPDLGEIDPEIQKDGYETGLANWDTGSGGLMADLSAKLPRSARRTFSQWVQATNIDRKGAFERRLIQKEADWRYAKIEENTAKIATMASQDPETAILLMTDYLGNNMQNVPLDKRDGLMDRANERLVRAVMETDLVVAEGLLDGRPDLFTAPGKRDQMKDEIQARRNQRRTDEQRAIDRNEGTLTARVLKAKREGNEVEVGSLLVEIETRLASEDTAQRIGDETGRILSNMLTDPHEPTQDEKYAAYARVNQAKINFLQGKGGTTQEQAMAVLRANLLDLDAEDAEQFVDAIQGGPTQTKDPMMAMVDDAVTAAKGLFDIWHLPAKAGEPTAGEIIARQRSEGEFAKRLIAKARQMYPESGKVDLLKVREMGVNLMEEMQNERVPANKKGPGILSKVGGFLTPKGGMGYGYMQQSKVESAYILNQEIQIGGKAYKVTGFDTDGEPLIEEVR